MKYQRITDTQDKDIPYLTSVFKMPEVSRYISIDEENYWNYVAKEENVYFFKTYNDSGELVAAIQCEIWDSTLYMAVTVVPEFWRKGIGTEILNDIKTGKTPLCFEKIEVSIDKSNTASIALFEKAGFKKVSKEDELINYIYEK